MADVKLLVELAEKAHNQEVIEFNRIHLRPHSVSACDTCVTLVHARTMVDQAEEYGENIVLYIP